MLTPIWELVAALAEVDPERPAITSDGATINRADLLTRASELAADYADLGVGAGTMVTVCLPNGIELYASCLAIWKLGGCPQPLSSRLPAAERTEIIALADPVLVVGGPPPDAGRAWLPAGHVPAGRPDEVVPTTPPMWRAMTSGGSTGRPKLIVATRPGAFDFDGADRTMLRPNDVQLVPCPLYHSSPFRISMQGLYQGQHLVVMPSFDAALALQAIDDHQVTFAAFVPTMLLRMWRVLEASEPAADLRSLRAILHTGAPCPPWLKRAWIDRLGPEKVLEAYGGSDSLLTTSITGTEWLLHEGSVGRPRRGEIKIVDDDGVEVEPGVHGEIFLRPDPDQNRGYRYVGAESRSLDGGWQSIGDLGWVDVDGYLYISDRRADLIVSGGANVYPAEVEAALLRHPAVDSCAVVGLPDPELGQRVHALVEANAPVEESALLAFVAAHLVRYKVPRSIRFVDVALRDDAGKVRRSELRDQEVARLAERSRPDDVAVHTRATVTP